MDLKQDTQQISEEKKNSSSSSSSPKSCTDCRTTRTPLWRGGPHGPKSLCNACGIKYNKKRRESLGLETGKNCRKKKRRGSASGGGEDRSSEIREILKMRFMSFGSEVLLQRSRKLMSKLREEEQAAILLMALSCGSVSA
ncbi:GATA transcription factor 15-like [Salvia miltiorrhiza]|uniref:GATA transcription factor 15-like n=1 Tax=Salvia miltiorrhiza TaxID=226208 RepID=UPI0025AD7CEC|nr:GATA transcription factor 15-like [Salvia miltiorrhiza]